MTSRCAVSRTFGARPRPWCAIPSLLPVHAMGAKYARFQRRSSPVYHASGFRRKPGRPREVVHGLHGLGAIEGAEVQPRSVDPRVNHERVERLQPGSRPIALCAIENSMVQYSTVVRAIRVPTDPTPRHRCILAPSPSRAFRLAEAARPLRTGARTHERSTMSATPKRGKQPPRPEKNEGSHGRGEGCDESAGARVEAAEDGESAVLPRSPRWRNTIAPSASASTRSSERAPPISSPKTWCTGCPRTRRTARSSVTSATRRSSRSATRCSASTTART